ncbi:MAG: M23 family metallopeptidase [Brevinematia bacterium]
MKKLIVILVFFYSAYTYANSTDVKVFYENKGRVYSFFADNPNIVPYQIVISFKKTREKFVFIIPENSFSNYLFSYTNDNEPLFRVKKIIGDPSRVKVNEDYPYLLPFKNGDSCKVTQAYKTRYTHKGWLKYSIDFGMKIGTPVYAARGGVVVEVKDTSRVGGRSRRYKAHSNYITIAHDDGTFAQYVHLNFSGSKVKVGDVVKAGDLIGYSGRTGRVTGPHLHFMVYKPIEEGLETIPVKFLTQDGELVTPEKSKFYTAYNPFEEDKNIPNARTNNTSTDDEEESLGEP